ncbi:hypothetical protein [Streptomyces sp. NPDC045470]|uniref:hypothetical protein n=1 Tax=Streptomyces sp. NPDC045470 TaxID=3155469 RepID=UPI0033E1F6DB
MRPFTAHGENSLVAAEAGRPDDAHLLDLVVGQVHRRGKDQLDPLLLHRLRIIRDTKRHERLLAAVLDCVVDKSEHRYDYRSYLALGVLELLLPSNDGPLTSGHLVRLLMADVVRFEGRAASGWADELLPAGRPGPETVRCRIRKARHLAVGTAAGRPLPTPPDALSSAALAYSVLPVSAQHDEYLFIRVLQAYETVFLAMNQCLDRALRAGRQHDAVRAAAGIRQAATMLADVGGLFSLLATMPPPSFHGFREKTLGSSAIQSRAYKALELLCALPPRHRLNGDAFRAVPDLRQQALDGPDTLAAWYLDTVHQMKPQQRRAVDAELARLERAHQKWKRTHHALARKMIGKAAGTGHTDGVDYLYRCLDNRLFWQIGARCPGHAVHISGGHDSQRALCPHEDNDLRPRRDGT